MRRWLGGALLVAAVTGCGNGTPQTAAPAGPPVRELRVGLSEYRLQLSAGAVLPGPVSVTVTNTGSAGHDVRLVQGPRGPGERVLGATALLPPGAREVLQLTVATGEAIRLDCTVPGHAEAGMTSSLAVG